MEKISIVIPAYNEEGSIGEVIHQISGALLSKVEYEIIVVDDGSNDLTAIIAERHGARVVSHRVNTGYGSALKSGIVEAKYPVIVFFDGDDSFYATDILKLLRYMGKYDMVIGARTRKKSELPLRTFLRWVFTKFSNFLAGAEFLDINSGFRIVKKELVVKFLKILPGKFSITTTMSFLFFKKRHSIMEVPIEVKGRRGGNKLKLLQDGVRLPFLVLKTFIHCSRFIGTFKD